MNIRYLFSGLLIALSVLLSPLARADFAVEASQVTPLLIGASVPNVTVKTADGSPVSLRAYTLQKPTIVLFYRGGWCPYCSRQLASFKQIEGELVELGYQIVAISPETPARLQEQKLETEFAVTLLSDNSLSAIDAFGIGYHMAMTTAIKYRSMGIALAEDSDGIAVLPAPALFFVNQQGLIEFAYVNPDYKVRPSADLVLNVAKVLAHERPRD